MPLNDYLIPSFPQILDFVRDLHLRLPYFRIIGWDISVDVNGNPTMIEWNRSAELSQVADSGKQIIGTRIPKWEELNDVIEKIRPQNSSVHFVGWDMALSKDGWCIVEGNWCPAIIGVQACSGIGYRLALVRSRKNARNMKKLND